MYQKTLIVLHYALSFMVFTDNSFIEWICIILHSLPLQCCLLWQKQTRLFSLVITTSFRFKQTESLFYEVLTRSWVIWKKHQKSSGKKCSRHCGYSWYHRKLTPGCRPPPKRGPRAINIFWPNQVHASGLLRLLSHRSRWICEGRLHSSRPAKQEVIA